MYDKHPEIRYADDSRQTKVFVGYPDIIKKLENRIRENRIRKNRFILAVDTYPGVMDEELIPELNKLHPGLFVNMRECFRPESMLAKQLEYYMTDDRVFGRMYRGDIRDFLDEKKLDKIRKKIQNEDGLIIIYGFGADVLVKGDCLVYCDMARWEIQMRFRNGKSNYFVSNGGEETLRKYKIGYFIEWRIADKHKISLFDKIDFYLDTNIENNPKMVHGNTLRQALCQTTKSPFRTVPYFDPGVWGGQWMKKVCNLDPKEKNYAWSFDGVPEENSLYYNIDNCVIEVPAINLVLYQPKQLLGERIYERFGAEFPIRFDFLDTMEGENLSLQVHPLKDYIYSQFGMNYTQDESYYIMDAKVGAEVYLGVKEDTKPQEMMEDLYQTQSGKKDFDADKYINRFPAKKHDHFLIPAGTIHCSGRNCMVLEISATPYIFTFKLWDWGRLGLDGKPRPIHIDHGKNVIQWNRRTKWVEENLVNQVYIEEENDDYLEEHTGLHKLEFIETRRYWIYPNKKCRIQTNGIFNILNLVHGETAIVESENGSFKPYTVHYAETFIIPATIAEYTICSLNSEKIGVIRAYVRMDS